MSGVKVLGGRCFLARIKRLLSRFLLIVEFCHDCGRETEAWTVEDWFWLKVVGRRDGTNLCVRCFDQRSRRLGFFPIFRLRVENVAAEKGLP